eukprot:1281161-Karenia_brevis.AAC.1
MMRMMLMMMMMTLVLMTDASESSDSHSESSCEIGARHIPAVAGVMDCSEEDCSAASIASSP